MIARASQTLLEKWAEPVSAGDGISVDTADVAVVMKHGSLAALLTAGRHQVPDGDVEIYFVSQLPRRLRAGGQSGSHADPQTGVIAATRAMLEYRLRVSDPARLLIGLGSAEGDEPIQHWVSAQLVGAVTAVLARQPSLVAVVADPMALADAVATEVNATLAEVGLEVTSIDDLMISIPEDDLANLRAALG